MYFRLVTALIGMLLYAGTANAAPFAYITNLSDNTVSVIDVENNGYVKKITLSSGLKPYGVAVSNDGTRVYVSCQGTTRGASKVAVIDALTNPADPSVLSYISLPDTPRGLAVNSVGTRLYVANEEGTLTVINLGTLAISSLTVGTMPTGVAMSSDGATVYVTNAGSNNITPIRASDNYIGTAFAAGSGPTGIVVGKAGTVNSIFVANETGNALTIINESTKAITQTVPLGANASPFGVAVSPDGTNAYVTKSGTDSIAIVGTTAPYTVSSLSVGGVPLGIAISSDGFRVFTANSYTNDVSAINTGNNVVTTLSNPADPESPYYNFFQSPQSLGKFVGPMLYTIEASAGANGSISPSGSVLKASGTNQIFTITPAANYRIDKVIVDGVNQVPAPASYTFSLISAPHAISASFIKDFDYVTVTKVGVGVNGVGTGTVTSNPGGINCGSGAACNATFNDGTSVTLTATPDAGSYFVKWVGDSNVPSVNVCDNVTSTTCTFTMSGYTHVTAQFSVATTDKVRMQPQGTFYSTIQAAFAAIASNTTDIDMTVEPFAENLTYNNNTGAMVNLNGGWTDRNFSALGATPTVNTGSFNITAGIIKPNTFTNTGTVTISGSGALNANGFTIK